MSTPTPAALLAAVARDQHGLFTRTQALAAGYASTTIDEQVRRGAWERAGREVLGLAGTPVTYRRAAMAAVLSIDGAVASHETAATLHGFRYLDAHPIVVSTHPARWNRLQGVIVHRYADLHPSHVVTVRSIPTTIPERTMIDLAAVLHPRRVELVLDGALGSGQVQLPVLLRTFNQVARRGRRGVGRIRPLLAERGDGVVTSDSELERRFAAFVTRHGLPMPARQLPTFWNDRLIGLADFAYVEPRLLIELDGRLGHAQLRDVELDRARDQRALAAGWRVVRITWRQLHREGPRIADVLRAALEARVA